MDPQAVPGCIISSVVLLFSFFAYWTNPNIRSEPGTQVSKIARVSTRQYGALASTTGTATRTPQIKNLIGLLRKNKCAARAARTYEQVRAVLCKITT